MFGEWTEIVRHT